jgi:hypothetical protein
MSKCAAQRTTKKVSSEGDLGAHTLSQTGAVKQYACLCVLRQTLPWNPFADRPIAATLALLYRD